MLREQNFVFVERAWDLKDMMQRSCLYALLTDKGDLNKGAIDWQADQSVIADFFLYILFNVESNSKFKGDRDHHFDEVSHALCSLQSNAQRIIHSISCVEICKLPLNKRESRS